MSDSSNAMDIDIDDNQTDAVTTTTADPQSQNSIDPISQNNPFNQNNSSSNQSKPQSESNNSINPISQNNSSSNHTNPSNPTNSNNFNNIDPTNFINNLTNSNNSNNSNNTDPNSSINNLTNSNNPNNSNPSPNNADNHNSNNFDVNNSINIDFNNSTNSNPNSNNLINNTNFNFNSNNPDSNPNSNSNINSSNPDSNNPNSNNPNSNNPNSNNTDPNSSNPNNSNPNPNNSNPNPNNSNPNTNDNPNPNNSDYAALIDPVVSIIEGLISDGTLDTLATILIASVDALNTRVSLGFSPNDILLILQKLNNANNIFGNIIAMLPENIQISLKTDRRPLAMLQPKVNAFVVGLKCIMQNGKLRPIIMEYLRSENRVAAIMLFMGLVQSIELPALEVNDDSYLELDIQNSISDIHVVRPASGPCLKFSYADFYGKPQQSLYKELSTIFKTQLLHEPTMANIHTILDDLLVTIKTTIQERKTNLLHTTYDWVRINCNYTVQDMSTVNFHIIIPTTDIRCL